MAALFILMLKTTILLEKLILEWLGVGDGDVNRFGISDSVKYAKKLEKMFTSWNLAK